MNAPVGGPQRDQRFDDPPALRFDENGLIPAIIHDAESGEVLMLGYMNAEALARTRREGRVTFFSRSRQELWRKGDTSGHTQHVRSIRHDCDGDTLLIDVTQVGAACHTGERTCFDGRPISTTTSHPEDTDHAAR